MHKETFSQSTYCKIIHTVQKEKMCLFESQSAKNNVLNTVGSDIGAFHCTNITYMPCIDRRTVHLMHSEPSTALQRMRNQWWPNGLLSHVSVSWDFVAIMHYYCNIIFNELLTCSICRHSVGPHKYRSKLSKVIKPAQSWSHQMVVIYTVWHIKAPIHDKKNDKICDKKIWSLPTTNNTLIPTNNHLRKSENSISRNY